MWIGGKKDDSDNWMWVDGTTMPLTTGDGGVWYQHTGGDGPSGNGKCLQIGYGGADWDDVECNSNINYSCEVSPCVFGQCSGPGMGTKSCRMASNSVIPSTFCTFFDRFRIMNYKTMNKLKINKSYKLSGTTGKEVTGVPKNAIYNCKL